MVSVRKISGPNPEPISLVDARLFLRQDVPGFNGDTMQDGLLLSWIRAARKVCEDEMDRVIGPQEFVLSTRGFGELITGCFAFPRGPIRSIEEVSFRLDTTLTYTALADSVYRLTDGGALVLNSGRAWPPAGYSHDSVRIRYTAGMGYPNDSDIGVEKIEDDVITAMRLLLGHFWFNRSAVVQAAGGGLQELPMGVKALLWPNRNSIGV